MSWQYQFEYGIALGIRWGLRRLSFQRAMAVARFIGHKIGPILPFDKRAKTNLRQIYPNLSNQQTLQLRREMYACFAQILVEYLFSDKLCEKKPTISGLEHIEAAQEKRQGILLVSAHFGSWEAIRVALKQQGLNAALLYRAFNNPYIDRETLLLATKIGTPVFHKGRKGLRGLIHHISEGNIGLLLTDQRITNAPKIPFLGKPAETSLVGAQIALAKQAALIPAKGERQADGRIHVTFYAPIEPSDAHQMTAEVNDHISEWITQKPEQWFWLHRRWGKSQHSTEQQE